MKNYLLNSKAIFLIFSIAFLGSPFHSFAQEKLAKAKLKQEKTNPTQDALAQIYGLYKAGDYEEAIQGLSAIEKNSSFHSQNNKEILGLVHYWKGLCLLRMNEFEGGIAELESAIKTGYKANDLFYEYGQALYTSLKLRKARVAFKKSILQKYKMAVSMYYIASISQELGDYKTAASFYNGIERLPMSEKKEVVQAARMSLGDIYLEQVKKQSGNSDSIEKYVLPQYRKALDWDDESALANEIKTKIEALQRQYELILFKLRNGRPTARPPYFLKANVKYSQNDNVNSLSEDSKAGLSAEEYSAASTNFGAYGRYAFYPSGAFSVIPEFTFNYTDYLSDDANIIINNNYGATASLVTTYEHSYNKAPATAYLNIDYSYNADDADADETLEKSSTINAFTFSEELQFWRGNPTIFRVKRSTTDAVLETSSMETTGFVFEQMVTLGRTMLYWYSAYDMNRYEANEPGDNNSTTFRLDALLPDFKGLFNTNFYASMKQSDYIEDADRGSTSLNTFGVNINRPFGKNYFVFFDLAMSSQTGDQETDNFKQQIMALNLDYIF